MKLQYGDNQSDEEKVRIFYQPKEKQKVATDFKQDDLYQTLNLYWNVNPPLQRYFMSKNQSIHIQGTGPENLRDTHQGE